VKRQSLLVEDLVRDVVHKKRITEWFSIPIRYRIYNGFIEMGILKKYLVELEINDSKIID
jgi:hypothetical protein